ncbi:MAG: transcription-repair coupling factor [Prevotella sp.]|nr:transcription-repair coupling factor [Prevotella sp.]
MHIQKLQEKYARLPQVAALAKALEAGITNPRQRITNPRQQLKTIRLEGLLASSAPMVFSGLAYRVGESKRACLQGQTLLFILQDAEDAGYFYHDLCQVMGDKDVLFFPSSYRRAIKYGQKDPASEILRTEVLTRLRPSSQPLPEGRGVYTSSDDKGDCSPPSRKGSGEGPLFIVSYPEAIAEQVVTRKSLDDRTLSLDVGETVNVGQVCETLRDFGFREVDYVYEPGQFALRGSILDVYSFSCEYPFRVDFFGNDIDSIRTFDVENQLSRERRDHIDIVPELTMAEEKESLFKFLPPQTVLVAKDFGFVRDSVERAWQEGFSSQALTERLENATEVEEFQIRQEMQRDNQIISGAKFETDSERFRKIVLGNQTYHLSLITYHFNTSPQPLFHKNFDLLTQTLEDYLLKGYKLFVLADSQKQIERLKDILAEKSGLTFEGVDRTLHEGFVDHDLRCCFFTDHQIFDRFHKYNLKSDKARGGKMALTLKEIQQFELGDFIVHVDHGVGKFGGLVRMPISNSQQPTADSQQYQEMIKIIYQRGDAIYVSIHSLYKVSKYKAQDGGQPPRLSTLGTGAWERLKERTKKHIKDIARDLIKLYAARRHQKGFAYSHDTYLQQELEASFLYEDTPDQLKATQDVKADMEKAIPMDRLVCGDVGFGKTEVAVRAAFKAAADGKQTAVLVPTTVLAYQHFRTFSSRLKDMPVRVDYLSRARSQKQTTAILKDLEEGKIDILIGTHKLISKTVKFKDLGLLIIDEEQKFGVSTKEKLRQMKTNVDTLTMSATPIPRTLQFSLVGARDLSVIQTPPPNRYPIQTEIHTFSAEIIADAINFEMSRNGQVFFVNNRINNLRELKDLILKYVPDCRVAIGHGQMNPEELEKIVLDFSNYDYDVLLSTTIVENGIDIPNANTIIINSAHNFGLSDLHQMRGRVGRGNRKAFCYLLAPPLSALPPDARRRLEALENFSDLGSGINIAMQDLDIRGAGNLLGAEQSGFISDLGYETYQKILNEAMAELRNESPTSPTPNPSRRGEGSIYSQTQKTNNGRAKEVTTPLPSAGGVGGGAGWAFVSDCTLESDLEMYFPDQYVPSDSERMLLYRELDNTRDDHELEAYRQRLIDRFGKMPKQAEELLHVVALRRLGKQLGCEKILLKQGRMFLYFVSNMNSPYYQSDIFGHIIDYATQNVKRCNLREQNGKRSMVITEVPTVGEAVAVLKKM